MSRSWGIALAALFCAAGILWRYLDAVPSSSAPEQAFANRELNCVDAAGGSAGKMLLIPVLPGRQFKIRIDGQDTVFDLATQSHFSDVFEAASGSQIVFNGTMHFTGPFGGKAGLCR